MAAYTRKRRRATTSKTKTKPAKPAKTKTSAKKRAVSRRETEAERKKRLTKKRASKAKTRARKPKKSRARKPKKSKAHAKISAKARTKKPARARVKKPATKARAKKPAKARAKKPAKARAKKPAKARAKKPAKVRTKKKQAPAKPKRRPRPPVLPALLEPEIPEQNLGTEFIERFRERSLEQGDDQSIPRKPERPLPYEGQRTGGQHIVVNLNEVLSEETLEPIMYRISRAANRLNDRFPNWMTTLFASSAGDQLFGSSKVMNWGRINDVTFQELGVDNSGIWSDRISMLTAVRALLEGFLSTYYRTSVVFLHSAIIRNYEYFYE